MRIFLVSMLLITVSVLKAQNFIPGSYSDYRSGRNMVPLKSDSTLNKKWSLNKYSGISTSFIGWKGGYATVSSAPIGMQLNRKINNNVIAFAGLSVAPSYINFHQTFMSADINKSSPYNSNLSKTNSFNLYPRAELGLSYTNDEGTFQISGSIGVERNNYLMPFYIHESNNGNPYKPRFTK